MIEVIALVATISFGLGTFFTKGVTTQISFLKSIGPLFLLNALFCLPLALVQRDWIVFEREIFLIHLTGAFLSGMTAYLIFGIIARSSASVAAVPQTLTPAVVLILAPIFLTATVTPLQIFFVVLLIGATVYPLRQSIPGLKSVPTLVMTIASGVFSGIVTVNVAMLGERGVNLSETFIVRQLIAGLVYVALFPPIGLNRADFFALVRRSSFMAIGWVTSIYAIQNGSVVVAQSILATVSLWVILFEVIAQRKAPERSTIGAALVAATGVIALAITSN